MSLLTEGNGSGVDLPRESPPKATSGSPGLIPHACDSTNGRAQPQETASSDDHVAATSIPPTSLCSEFTKVPNAEQSANGGRCRRARKRLVRTPTREKMLHEILNSGVEFFSDGGGKAMVSIPPRQPGLTREEWSVSSDEFAAWISCRIHKTFGIVMTLADVSRLQLVLRGYCQARQVSKDPLVENPLLFILIQLCKERPYGPACCKELLTKLKSTAQSFDIPPKHLPDGAPALGKALRKLKGKLAQEGLVVDTDSRSSKQRSVTISRIAACDSNDSSRDDCEKIPNSLRVLPAIRGPENSKLNGLFETIRR